MWPMHPLFSFRHSTPTAEPARALVAQVHQGHLELNESWSSEVTDSKWRPNAFGQLTRLRGECHAHYIHHHECIVHLLGCTKRAWGMIHQGRVAGLWQVGYPEGRAQADGVLPGGI